MATYSNQRGAYSSNRRGARKKAGKKNKTAKIIIFAVELIVIALMIGVAVMLGLVVLYNLSELSFVEKVREYTTLKVLGLQERVIRGMILTQHLRVPL